MRKTLSLPVRPDRGSFRNLSAAFGKDITDFGRGNFRIMLKPAGRKERRKYYAANSEGMFWTDFREIASEFPTENIAYGIAARIIANNAKLRSRVGVVPA